MGMTAATHQEETEPEIRARAALCLQLVARFWPEITKITRQEELAVRLMHLPEEVLKTDPSRESLEALLLKK